MEMQWGLLAMGLWGCVLVSIGFSSLKRIQTKPKKGWEHGLAGAYSGLEKEIKSSRSVIRLQHDLELLDRAETLQSLVRRQWVYGCSAFLAGITLWLYNFHPGGLLFGTLCASLAYQSPVRKIHREAQALRREWERQLPLLQLGILQRMLAGQSPLVAVRGASQTMSASLQGEMRRLLTDMEMTGDAAGAWERWTKRMDSPYARRFAGLLKLTMTVHADGMERSLRAAYLALRQEQQDRWRRQARQLPQLLQWPNLILFASLITLPVLSVGIGISRILRTF
ncbi:type II secretion system F family protein [Effusibacillus consociatus]|uniref:Type II secretion system F family protein n=1 Tax=Effusibacillus consociatus TaxID=1117041 RepID=A0ABV9Q1P4_9BACL